MKIYIITGTPFPTGMAPTNRIKCYAKAMNAKGIKCEVVLYLQSKISFVKKKGCYENIYYNYIGKQIQNKGGLLRRIEYFIDELRLLCYLNRVLKKDDVVISYGATVGFTPLVVKVTHMKKAKFVLELVELPYGTSAETEKMVLNRKKIFQQFPTYDGVLAISDALANLAKKHLKGNGIVEKIPILVEYDKYNIPDRSSESDVPYVFHSGSLFQQKDGFVGMIEAFGILTTQYKKDVKFVSTGSLDKCPHKNEVKALIDKYNLKDKVVFTGYLDETTLSDYLSKAALVIINKYRTQQNIYCFSTKLGEYMAAGKPVIITNVGEAVNWLTDGLDSCIIEPEDSQVLAQSIQILLEDEKLKKHLSQNAKISCQEKFDYHSYGAVFVEFFKKITYA